MAQLPSRQTPQQPPLFAGHRLGGTDEVTLETLAEQARGPVLAFEVAGKTQLDLLVDDTLRLRTDSRDTALPASELLGRQLVREAYRQPRRSRAPRAQPQAVTLTSVLDLAMSPDEKLVAAVGRPAAVTVWDLESGMLLHRRA